MEANKIKYYKNNPCIEANVVMLSTDKSTGIFGLKTNDGIETLHYSIMSKIRAENKSLSKGYHLYITSDEEIKKYDWYLQWLNNEWLLSKADCHSERHIKDFSTKDHFGKKIIATTDKSLFTIDKNCSICNGEGKEVTSTTISRFKACECKEYLAEPSQAFIEAFAKANGVGFDKVLVEVEIFDDPNFIEDLNKEMRLTPKILNKLLIDPNHNTITIHPVEECEHPFKRLHWVDNKIYCNKCRTTLIKNNHENKKI